MQVVQWNRVASDLHYLDIAHRIYLTTLGWIVCKSQTYEEESCHVKKEEIFMIWEFFTERF